MNDKTFLTLGELSEKTGLPQQSLKLLAQKKEIPSLRIGRRLFFKVEAVEQSLLKQELASEGGSND